MEMRQCIVCAEQKPTSCFNLTSSVCLSCVIVGRLKKARLAAEEIELSQHLRRVKTRLTTQCISIFETAMFNDDVFMRKLAKQVASLLKTS